MPAFSRIDLSNRSLARIRAKAIVSVGENSLEARECRRFYPQIMSEMLEGPNAFSFAIQRASLALLAANDRPEEWLYAYALPANLASPIRVLPNLAAMGLALPVPLIGDPYFETWAASGGFWETPYIIDGSTLYSNETDAVIEYTINDISGINIPALVALAVEIDLGARLAVPVKGDSAREKDLMGMAEVAWERAIADDRNRQPENSGNYVSEAMVVRGGSLGV
jgi:hypothetical protein